MTRRTLTTLVLVALAFTMGAVVLLSGLRPANTSPPAAAATNGAPLRTPLWSARRAPTFLARAVESSTLARARVELTQRLATIVAPVRGCVAVDSPLGTVARVDADVALAPASTLKLLTATTAIDHLGADHRFTTRAFIDEDGDLDIVGAGDPLLATPEHIAYEHAQPRFAKAPFTPLSQLADAIVAAGVHHVSGSIAVDDHLHETLRFLPVWKPVYATEGDIGSLGALTVDGGWADARDQTPAGDPALTTGQRLEALLAARGVTVEGGVRRAAASADAHEIAHVDSVPLFAIIGEMLTSSDNYTAEELLRDIAVGTAGTAPATTAMGTVLVRQELVRLGIPTTGVVLHDGSGLAPTDRVTCAVLLQVVELSSRPKYAAIDRGLPIAAETGTLAIRFGGSALAGKLRAKTGSLDGVVGLVGVIDRPDQLHFAFVANGNFSDAGGEQMQADVASAVASTPDLRAPTHLVPAP